MRLYYKPAAVLSESLAFKKSAKSWRGQLANDAFKKKKIYEQNFFNHNVEQLRQALKDAIDIDINLLDDSHPMFALAQKMRDNIWHFSYAKLESFKKDLKLVSKKNLAQFRRGTGALLDKYDVWGKTEYNLALASGQQAEKWQIVQDKKGALPYLQYDAIIDGRTRDAHKALDRITLPVDDPFWQDFYPPNGYNCRCTALQVAGGLKRPKKKPTKKEVPAVFRNNTGNSGVIFKSNAGYLKRLKKKPATIQKAIKSLLSAVQIFEIIDGVKTEILK